MLIQIKSWTKQFAFYSALIPLGQTWIHLFSSNPNLRVNWGSSALVHQAIQLKNWPCVESCLWLSKYIQISLKNLGYIKVLKIKSTDQSWTFCAYLSILYNFSFPPSFITTCFAQNGHSFTNTQRQLVGGCCWIVINCYSITYHIGLSHREKS